MLSVRMTEGRDERKILELAATSVPSLVDCQAYGAFLDTGGWSLTSGPLAESAVRADVEAQFSVISDAGGALSIQGIPWGWAFPLRSLAGTIGYLVVGAEAEPSTFDQFTLRTLAQQVGIAIANARLDRRQLAVSAELRAANAQLAESLDAIKRRAEIHERLTRAAMTGTGLVGIVGAIHELAGYPIVLEDRAGTVIAQAGAESTARPTRRSASSREETIRRALAAGRPVHEPGRVVVIADPNDGATGVLSLIDPAETAGEAEIVALEHGATVVGMELTRLRRLRDTQLRLGRDFLDDLLVGVDETAIDRASALGLDFSRPHRVAVVIAGGEGHPSGDLGGAVMMALSDHPAGWLATPRGDGVVVLADAETDWDGLHARITRAVDGCKLGIGSPATDPATIPRSHREALIALKMAAAGGSSRVVTFFDDLGVFRLFAEVENPATVELFVRSWIGDLLDYDTRKRADLVRTLGRYLDLGQSYDATCQALTIHRSTLKYRLQRISEISGCDLKDPDTRFNLQLATRAWQTLNAMRASDVRAPKD